jgi:hypothetical protein
MKKGFFLPPDFGSTAAPRAQGDLLRLREKYTQNVAQHVVFKDNT